MELTAETPVGQTAPDDLVFQPSKIEEISMGARFRAIVVLETLPTILVVAPAASWSIDCHTAVRSGEVA